VGNVRDGDVASQTLNLLDLSLVICHLPFAIFIMCGGLRALKTKDLSPDILFLAQLFTNLPSNHHRDHLAVAAK